MNRVLHISYTNDCSDGGVYFYLKEYINIQRKSGIDCHWISIKSNNIVGISLINLKYLALNVFLSCEHALKQDPR